MGKARALPAVVEPLMRLKKRELLFLAYELAADAMWFPSEARVGQHMADCLGALAEEGVVRPVRFE